MCRSVAVIDGKIFPLCSVEIDVENETERLRDGMGSTKTFAVVGRTISGSFESYRPLVETETIKAAKTHTVYVFGESHERIQLHDVIFSPGAPVNNRRTQTLDFVAKEVEYD